MNKVLLTGGLGYIGTHIAALLAEQKNEFVIYDNFSNCKENITDRLIKLTGTKIKFIRGDIRDTEKLFKIIKENQIYQ